MEILIVLAGSVATVVGMVCYMRWNDKKRDKKADEILNEMLNK